MATPEMPWATEALTLFFADLADDIKSPEALEVEAEYRLKKLQELLDSGQWASDEKGNVFPADTPPWDRKEIDRKCRFTILDRPPEIVGVNSWKVKWEAVGSLLVNVTIHADHSVINPKITFQQTHVIDRQIHLS